MENRKASMLRAGSDLLVEQIESLASLYETRSAIECFEVPGRVDEVVVEAGGRKLTLGKPMLLGAIDGQIGEAKEALAKTLREVLHDLS